jgi:LuxR family maltose regulon positive regulatory protein
MLHDFVDSRLGIPPAPFRHVPRPRLLAELEAARDIPLVLLSAGPGTGKTVLLAEWARRTPLRVAWLCPAPGDDDPSRFRQLLSAALDAPANPGSGHGVPPQGRTIDFVHALLEQLPSAGPALVLAIDDAHVLTDPNVTSLLDALVRCGHPRLHLVLAARGDPALPLHRYRLAGHLRELRAADLALTSEETWELLAAHDVTLPVSALNALTARTEGWVAGVRLTAMRMEHSSAPARLVRELSFDHGGAGEYLLAEVLDPQPPALRRVLIETSFLDEVTRPLAEAVTGIDGAGEMLAEFARDSSFASTLDPAATRFRYHRLFAEVLRYLLARDTGHEIRMLAARAASRFESEGDLGNALYWAARAGDQQQAARVLVHGGLAHAFTRRESIPGAELAETLAGVPPPADPSAPEAPRAPRTLPTPDGAPSSGPDITLAAAVFRAVTADARSAVTAGELDRARDIAAADQRADATPRETSALAELMLGMRAGDPRAVDAAASRLTGVRLAGKQLTDERLAGNRLTGQRPTEDMRGAVLLAQASTHFWDGAYPDVDDLLSQALTAALDAGQTALAAEALGMTAYASRYSGRPRHADDAAAAARALIREHPRLRAPLSLRLSAVIKLVQRADLPGAARHLRHTPVPGAIGADPGLAAVRDLWQATVAAQSGRLDEARAMIENASAGTPLPPLLEIHRDVDLSGIEIRLGRPEAALGRLEPHRHGRFAALADVACARAYLLLDDIPRAQQCVRRVLTAAPRQAGRYTLVEAMLASARIAERERDTARTLEMITNALDVAQSDIVLPFVQARETLGRLLSRHPGVARRWPGPPDPASGTAEPEPDRGEPGGPSRPVPLTDRERSVLTYLASSMTAAEIADELYVSVNTVKTHLGAIYRKLSAGGRREAVRRARELELL